jgi:hypothetical protein
VDGNDDDKVADARDVSGKSNFEGTKFDNFNNSDRRASNDQVESIVESDIKDKLFDVRHSKTHAHQKSSSKKLKSHENLIKDLSDHEKSYAVRVPSVRNKRRMDEESDSTRNVESTRQKKNGSTPPSVISNAENSSDDWIRATNHSNLTSSAHMSPFQSQYDQTSRIRKRFELMEDQPQSLRVDPSFDIDRVQNARNEEGDDFFVNELSEYLSVSFESNRPYLS